MTHPVAIHDLPAEAFPFTLRVRSKTGVVLFERVVETPRDGLRVPVRIPGYGGTEHAPVSVEIDFPRGYVPDE